jgi:hypothetical protein
MSKQTEPQAHRHDIQPDWNKPTQNGGFGGTPKPEVEPETEVTETKEVENDGA